MAQLANQLNHTGVLQTSGRSALQRINHHASRVKKVFRFDAVIGSILYIKKSLVDPDRLLARMDPYFSWMYTRGYVHRRFGAAMAVTLFMLCRVTRRNSPCTARISSRCKTLP